MPCEAAYAPFHTFHTFTETEWDIAYKACFQQWSVEHVRHYLQLGFSINEAKRIYDFADRVGVKPDHAISRNDIFFGVMEMHTLVHCEALRWEYIVRLRTSNQGRPSMKESMLRQLAETGQVPRDWRFPRLSRNLE